MYNTKFVQKLAFAYRNCPLILETTKHFQAYINCLLWSGIENFPKCAVYDIVNGLILIFAQRTNLQRTNLLLFASVWLEVTWPPLRARFLDTFQVRRCWVKIDSAMNLWEKPSSEFVQCVLWVIRLTKTVSRSAVLFATLWHLTNDTLRRLTPAVTDRPPPSYDASSPFRRCRLLHSCSNASSAQRLLLAASYICLVTFSVLYYVTVSFFSYCTP